MPEMQIMSGANLQASLYRILDSIKQLPSPPEVCLAVTRATQDDRTTLNDLQTLVENDIALSGRLMQVANSAFFGVREPVTSVRRAIGLLGFGAVRSLALGFYFNDEFGKLRLPGLPYPDLPRYALAGSAVAEAVAGKAAPDLAADAACLGLLHESGVIVMAMAFGKQYRRMLAGLDLSRQRLEKAEARLFGVDHVVAGKLLLSGWRMSEPFVTAVAHHHDNHLGAAVEEVTETLWKVLRLAAHGALLFFHEDVDEQLREETDLARRLFGWEQSELAEVFNSAARTYQVRTGILGMAPQRVTADVQAAAHAAAMMDGSAAA